MAATISSPLCQEQLIESARSVTRSIEAVLQACVPPITHEQFYSELSSAGRTVRQTLNEFLLHIKLITDSTAAHSDRLFSPIIDNLNPIHTKSTGPHRIVLVENLTELTEEEEEEDEAEADDEVAKTNQSIDQILIASDRLFSSIGDATEMVKQAKILAQSTAQLVSALRHQAESIDGDTQQQQKFLAAAKMLADATAKMVESAKGCATRPADTQSQYQLKRAVEELRLATHMANSQQNQRKIFQRIEQCAKHSASCATQCIAATSASALTNRAQPSHQQLVEQCKIVADLIPRVVQGMTINVHEKSQLVVVNISGIRTCMIQPGAWSFQMNLLHACEDFYAPARHLADLAQTVAPTVHNQSQSLHLNQSSKDLLQALTDLRAALTRVRNLPSILFSRLTTSFSGRGIVCIGTSRYRVDHSLHWVTRPRADRYSPADQSRTVQSENEWNRKFALMSGHGCIRWFRSTYRRSASLALLVNWIRALANYSTRFPKWGFLFSDLWNNRTKRNLSSSRLTRRPSRIVHGPFLISCERSSSPRVPSLPPPTIMTNVLRVLSLIALSTFSSGQQHFFVKREKACKHRMTRHYGVNSPRRLINWQPLWAPVSTPVRLNAISTKRWNRCLNMFTRWLVHSIGR